MSQRYVVERVEVEGASPYLGADSDGAPRWSKDADEVMRWLCGCYRRRFNERRANRCKWIKGGTQLVPLGVPNDLTDRLSRESSEWMGACPTRVLNTTMRMEDTEWYAAVRRRETLRGKGQRPGAMPGFRKRKKGLRFDLYYNEGHGFTFQRFSRKHAVVVIGGMNPKNRRLDGAKWRIVVHIRTTKGAVRPFTCIHVDWSRRFITFVSPVPKRKHETTGRAVGLDVGVAHAVTDSDGVFHDLPVDRLKAIDREIKSLQKAMARCLKESEYESWSAYWCNGPSKRFLELKKRADKSTRRRTAVIEDWQHKLSRKLVDGNDLIAVEDLNVKGMTGKPKAKPDPEHPGGFLPNGRAAKRSLHKGILTASWSRLKGMLAYKANVAGIMLIEVDPKFTSQRCSRCGYTHNGNRESQAVFRCAACGYEGNADVNAAVNIRNRGLSNVGVGRGGTRPGAEADHKTRKRQAAPSGSSLEARSPSPQGLGNHRPSGR